GETAAGVGMGSAYVYRRAGATWIEEGHVFSFQGAPTGFFGRCVDVDQDRLIVSAPPGDVELHAPGSAYLFRYLGPTCGWVADHHLVARTPGESEGFGAVAISGDTALVGCWQDDTAGGIDTGAINLYDSAEVVLDVQPNPVPPGQSVTFTTGYGDVGESY